MLSRVVIYLIYLIRSAAPFAEHMKKLQPLANGIISPHHSATCSMMIQLSTRLPGTYNSKSMVQDLTKVPHHGHSGFYPLTNLIDSKFGILPHNFDKPCEVGTGILHASKLFL